MSTPDPSALQGSKVENRLESKIEKKMRIADDLFKMAFEVKKFQLQLKFPDLSEREINHRVYALIEKGCR